MSFFTMYTHFNQVLKITALQNANKKNLDSLDISSLIQFEEPWSTVFTLLSVIVIRLCYGNWHPVHAVNHKDLIVVHMK